MVTGPLHHNRAGKQPHGRRGWELIDGGGSIKIKEHSGFRIIWKGGWEKGLCANNDGDDNHDYHDDDGDRDDHHHFIIMM